MNYQDALNEGLKILKFNNIKSFLLDSELLLSYSLNLERSELILNLDKKISEKEYIRFFNYINRRKKKEPIAYIVGYKEFWKKKFKVDKSVLIPRPDTELIVEEVLKNLSLNCTKKILDIGTGSGCILISILLERPKCHGLGADISAKAIKIAKYNAKIQQLSNRIKFLNSNVDNILTGKYDLIVSNPPYIKKNKVNSLDCEIKFFEPKTALDGGADGFEKIKKIISKSYFLLKTNGKLYLEIGFDQFYKVNLLLLNKKFQINRVVKDLGNKNRCIVATKI